jgi:hypothetical protein
MTSPLDRRRELLAQAKRLAAEYYALTGKPLGVTGEVAEHVVADMLHLELAAPRTKGHDALRHLPCGGVERIEIKGRAFDAASKRAQRIGRIKRNADCDVVLLVLLDIATLDPREIWEARYSDVSARLAMPGSKSRERGALGVNEFKRLAKCIWPKGAPSEP